MDRKPVLITGCSSGIGLSTARLLQQRNYRVFAGVKNLTDAERLQEMGLETLQLNLADKHQVTTAADAFLQQTQGKCHALINNGAFGQPGAVEDLSRTTLEKQFACNVFGTHPPSSLPRHPTGQVPGSAQAHPARQDYGPAIDSLGQIVDFN